MNTLKLARKQQQIIQSVSRKVNGSSPRDPHFIFPSGLDWAFETIMEAHLKSEHLVIVTHKAVYVIAKQFMSTPTRALASLTRSRIKQRRDLLKSIRPRDFDQYSTIRDALEARLHHQALAANGLIP